MSLLHQPSFPSAPGREVNLDIAVAPTDKVVIPQSWKTLAKTFYNENREAAAHKKGADAARKDLLSVMQDGKVNDFVFTTTSEETGKPMSLTVAINTTVTDKIDVEKLIAVVGLKEVMAVLSASKGAVEAVFGSAIATQCSIPTEGSTNVSVKVAK